MMCCSSLPCERGLQLLAYSPYDLSLNLGQKNLLQSFFSLVPEQVDDHCNYVPELNSLKKHILLSYLSRYLDVRGIALVMNSKQWTREVDEDKVSDSL